MLIRTIGSLIARIIFQPVEETLQLHFSRQLRTHPSSTRHLLTYVLHLSSHLLLLLPAFLPPILPVLLPLLLPARYRHTTAPSTLETYLTYYIPLMSLNGILEAFHASSATPAEIGKQARWMMASSVGFAGALWTLSSSRPGGITTEQCLVLASCVSMAVRIVYAGGHARRYFASRSDQGTSIKVAEVLPHPATLAITAVAAAVLRRAAGVQIILATGAFGVLTLAVLYVHSLPSTGLRADQVVHIPRDRECWS
jgi:oligosaccharide translocation protein RFT1